MSNFQKIISVKKLLAFLGMVMFSASSFGQTDTLTTTKTDSLSNDTLIQLPLDTTLALGDNLNDRVVYSSFDSLWVDVRNNEIHLYLNAAVKYEDISLEAHHIIINSVNNTIRAEGLRDSAGVMRGTPIYKEGDQMYKASEMTYNFKTKKAWIKDAVTEAQGGFLIGDEVKMVDKNTIYTKGNIYTTCDRTDHPHFGIRITKGKYIPDEKIVAGPSYLEIGDVPLPIGLPFAYYPLNQQKRHGLIFPEFGESPAQGFFLRGLGYYFPLGQKAALELRSDIYSLGSYRLNTRVAYNKRYKFSGSFSADYSSTQTGDPEDTGVPANKQIFFRWNHSQSPKARPNSRFSASVNAGSNGFWRDNSFATNTFTQNSFNSSISYDKTFAGTPFSMNLALRHSQNTQSKVIDLTAPDLALNMRRITPFKRKVKVGSAKWYEKVGLSYSMQARNNYSSPDSVFFDNSWSNKLSSGILHKIPLSTSLKIFKYVQVSPNVEYNERWYFRKIDRRFDLASNSIVLDSVNGFFTARD